MGAVARTRLVILGVAALLVTVRCLLPAGVFWISDAGNKYLVAQNLVASGFREVAIGYPAADLDPAFRWFPTAGEHFVRVGTRFFSIASFVFPAAAAPLVALFGAAGATILPLAGGIGILLLVPALVRVVDERVSGAVAVAAVAFATPIAFYSLDFWEHTTATFFATLALLLFVRGRPLAAGVVLGVSIAFREEGYVLLAAIAGAALFNAGRAALPRFLAGVAAMLAPLAIAQQLVYGNVFGIHLAAHAGGDGVPLVVRIPRNVLYFLLQFHERIDVAMLLAAAPLLAILAGAFRLGPRVRLAANVAVLVAAAAGVAMILANRDPIEQTSATQGMLLFVPCLAPFVVRWRELASRTDAAGFLARAVCLYIVLMLLVLRANWTGIIWGPRYFLTILPAAVVLALASIDAGRAARAVVAALFAVAVTLEVYGLVLLQRKLEATAQLVEALRAAPQVVITDVFWLPEEASALFFEKKIVMPQNSRELALAIATLRARGVSRFAYVSSPRFRWYGDPARNAIARMRAGHTRVATPGVPLLTVDIHDVPLRR